MKKRPTTGDLSLPTNKKVCRGIGNSFFNNNELVVGCIAPLLNEWDNYNLSLVNKSCSTSINRDYYGKLSRHYMYQYFFRKQICMICLKTCTGGDNCSQLGLHCHLMCIPKYHYYDIKNGVGIPIGVSELAPGMEISVLYDTPNPFIINHKLTIQYNTRREFSIYYSLYEQSMVSDYLELVRNAVSTVEKDESVNAKIDMKKKIRVGSNTVSLYHAFCMRYPHHMTLWNVDTIVTKYHHMASNLSTLHGDMVKFFSEVIRPKLFIRSVLYTSTWGHFVRYLDNELDTARISFYDWIHKHNYIDDRQKLKTFMLNGVARYNEEELHLSVLRTVGEMCLMFTSYTDMINVTQTFSSIVRWVCSTNNPILQHIIETTVAADVYRQTVSRIIQPLMEFSIMMINVYSTAVTQNGYFTLHSLKTNVFNTIVNRMIKRSPGIVFSINRVRFAERVAVLSTNVHLFDILGVYVGNENIFYTEAIKSKLLDKKLTRMRSDVCVGCTSLLSDNVPCTQHTLCGRCCSCGT